MSNRKKQTKGHRITRIMPDSIGEELGIEPGDWLMEINGQVIEDVFDYRYAVEDELVNVLIRKADGEEWLLEIEKDEDEDLGIEFETSLMSDYRSCSNKCIFCFIDQMPEGMRDTLYFKDDDSRLSFMQGNYITLTNMKQKDIDRIIRLHLAPINISIHTTNPELRCRMLHNRFAGKVLRYLDDLYEHGIEMNGQIVLCQGVNDGEELQHTLDDLEKYIPCMQSVSVVPSGLTKYRDGLYPLELVSPENAARTIAIVEQKQRECMERYGIHFAHASDELYDLAGLPVPEAERYDGYIQLENGVGMVRLLREEVRECLEALKAQASADSGETEEGIGKTETEHEATQQTCGERESSREGLYVGPERLQASADSGEAGEGIRKPETGQEETRQNCGGKESSREGLYVESERAQAVTSVPRRKVTIATGRIAEKELRGLAEEVMEAFPQVKVQVVPIRNHFFGESITVTGLITGQDLAGQLKELQSEGFEIGDALLLSSHMFRTGERVFLDDMTQEDVEERLGVRICPVDTTGADLVEAILNPDYVMGRVNDRFVYLAGR